MRNLERESRLDALAASDCLYNKTQCAAFKRIFFKYFKDYLNTMHCIKKHLHKYFIIYTTLCKVQTLKMVTNISECYQIGGRISNLYDFLNTTRYNQSNNGIFYKINQVVLYVTLRGRIRKYYLKTSIMSNQKSKRLNNYQFVMFL